MPVKRYRYKKRRKSKKMPKGFKKNFNRAIRSLSEKKFHDYTKLVTASTTTTGIDLALSIGQNVTDVTRIGDHVILNSIELRYNVKADPNSVTNFNCRMMIIQWFENSTPAVGDILQNSATGGATVSPVTMDVHREKTLKVLWDKTHSISATTAGTVGVNVHRFLKGFTRNIYFVSGAATPSKGALYFVNVSDAAATSPIYNLICRTTWIDP